MNKCPYESAKPNLQSNVFVRHDDCWISIDVFPSLCTDILARPGHSRRDQKAQVEDRSEQLILRKRREQIRILPFVVQRGWERCTQLYKR